MTFAVVETLTNQISAMEVYMKLSAEFYREVYMDVYTEVYVGVYWQWEH